MTPARWLSHALAFSLTLGCSTAPDQQSTTELESGNTATSPSSAPQLGSTAPLSTNSVSHPSESSSSAALATSVGSSNSSAVQTHNATSSSAPSATSVAPANSTLNPTESGSPTTAELTPDPASSVVTASTAETTAPDTTTTDLPPVTVFLAGDSTVSQYTDTNSSSDQAGWGQMLHEYVTAETHVDNRAIGGRTARRFIDEGFLEEISAVLAAGDTLMVQFGTNDGNRTATYEFDGEEVPYYLEPATDFKTYLNQYIDLAASRDAIPVLVTPPPRNSAYCTGGNGTGAHAEAMRELGVERDVTVLDLNAQSVAYLTAICPAPMPEDFFLLRADGSVDGTHFQENGARLLAGFVADELVRTGAALASYVLPR